MDKIAYKHSVGICDNYSHSLVMLSQDCTGAELSGIYCQ
jgi:hypothetical protein